jgi:putative salt-induced outer membrane protein
LRTSLIAALTLLTAATCGPVAPIQAAPALSPDPPAISEADRAAIQAAAGAHDLPALYKALFTAVAAAPDRLAAIVAEAAGLAPEFRDAITRTMESAFPESRAAIREAEAEAQAPPLVPPAPSEAQPPAPQPWSGEIAASAGTATGNSPLDTIGFATTVVYTTGPWEHEAGLSYDFSRNSQTTSVNRLELEYSPSYHFTDRFFALALGRFVRDRNEDFHFTAIQAAGPGYDVIKTEDMTLSLAAGPGLRQERERKGEGGRLRNEEVGVATSEYAWDLTDRLQFSNDASVVGNTYATWIDTTSAVTVKFDENFSGRLSYSIRHNTDPPGDDNKTDTLSRAAIVYGFGR